MRVVREGDLVPLWGGRGGQPGPRGWEMQALAAFVEAHVADPSRNWGQEMWERLVEGGHVPGAGAVEQQIARGRRREGRREVRRVGVEEVVRKAGLTGRETEAMEAVQRWAREDGEPDWREITREMGVTRATAKVYWERGKEKIGREIRRQKRDIQKEIDDATART